MYVKPCFLIVPSMATEVIVAYLPYAESYLGFIFVTPCRVDCA